MGAKRRQAQVLLGEPMSTHQILALASGLWDWGVAAPLRLPAAMHWEGHAKVLAQGNTVQRELKTALETACTAAVRHS
jgi:hypothetical protein